MFVEPDTYKISFLMLKNWSRCSCFPICIFPNHISNPSVVNTSSRDLRHICRIFHVREHPVSDAPLHLSSEVSEFQLSSVAWYLKTRPGRHSIMYSQIMSSISRGKIGYLGSEAVREV